MKKVTKVFLGALVLTIILIVAITGVAAAAGPYNGEYPGKGECQNGGECRGDCDCQCEGDCVYDCECQCDSDCRCGCESQSETESLEGDSGVQTQTMAQVCNTTCEQNRENYQNGDNGNCYSIQNSYNHQYKHGVGNNQ